MWQCPRGHAERVEIQHMAALVALFEETPGEVSVRYEGDRWIASGQA